MDTLSTLNKIHSKVSPHPSTRDASILLLSEYTNIKPWYRVTNHFLEIMNHPYSFTKDEIHNTLNINWLNTVIPNPLSSLNDKYHMNSVIQKLIFWIRHLSRVTQGFPIIYSYFFLQTAHKYMYIPKYL